MGGLVEGTSGQKGVEKQRFASFLSLMGPEYKKLEDSIWSEVRNGLAHSYFIAQSSTVKMTIGKGRGDKCGVEVDAKGKVWFIVERYFYDFKTAVRGYHRQVKADEALRTKFQTAIRNLPALGQPNQ